MPDLSALHEAIAGPLAGEPCIVSDRVLTWCQVTDRTRRLAAVLRGAGLGGRPPSPPPDWETGQHHLGILLHNSAEYVEGLIGAHKASVVPFNVNFRYTADELEYLFRDARPDALLYGAEFAAVVEQALSRLGRRPVLLQLGAGPLLPGALAYEPALAAADPARGVPDSSPEDRYLQYTGGTTGMPKGVIWRIGDLVAGPLGVRHKDGTPITSTQEAVARATAMRGRVLAAPPFMHGAGTGFALGGLLRGATVVIQPRPERLDAAVLIDTCERERVTSMAIVGDAFGDPLVTELERRPRELALRLLVNSGAGLRDELKDRLRELVPGLTISDMLGSSETGLHARKGEGNRFDGRGTATVLDLARTRVLTPGEDAVGWVAQSGAMAMGYLGDQARTRETFVRVGDRRYSVPGELARHSADGSIEFLGREATTINTGGEKVFADEVELVLRALPGVRDAVVVGRPSRRWGQEVVALYRPSDQAGPTGAEPTGAELADGCRERLAGYKVPKVFLRVAEVRRHANGKPDYAWARDTALASIQQETR